MATTIARDGDQVEGFIRRKSVSVRNDGSMRSVIDAGQFGTFVTDEPVAHGGGSGGPSPLQSVLGVVRVRGGGHVR